jgi:hypothetical protein
MSGLRQPMASSGFRLSYSRDDLDFADQLDIALRRCCKRWSDYSRSGPLSGTLASAVDVCSLRLDIGVADDAAVFVVLLLNVRTEIRIA